MYSAFFHTERRQLGYLGIIMHFDQKKGYDLITNASSMEKKLRVEYAGKSADTADGNVIENMP